MADEVRALTSAEEEQKISRSIMIWINTYPYLPVNIVDFEQLRVDVCMALSTIQATAIIQRFITGGYRGEYQFKIVYRFLPGISNDARLKADELLNAIGDWARDNPPSLGDDLKVVKMEPTTRSGIYSVYDNGFEDHQIMMRMIYEVIK